ncbi:MAG: LDL receptor domain-containing protein, partial [Schleiferiaceae bacterium]
RESLLIDLLNRIPDIDDSDLVQELEPAMDEPGNQEEITQTSSSKKSKFTCKDGTSIELAWIGDGECDCPDCEDEN